MKILNTIVLLLVVTSAFAVTRTVTESLVMREIAAPAICKDGTFILDSADSKFKQCSANAWTGVGGGAGGSRLNLIIDPSFETDVSQGTCTTCTASQETTACLLTDTNAACLKMALSASVGDYTDTTVTSAQYTNASAEVSAYIKTSALDVSLCSMVDGSEDVCLAIASNDEWKKYVIPTTTGTASFGYKVKAASSITDDIFVDETYSGVVKDPFIDIAQAQFYGSVKWDTTANCAWVVTNAAPTVFPVDADCDDNARTIKGMYNSTNGDVGNSDGQTPKIKFSTMGAGTYRVEMKSLLYAGSASGCNFTFYDGTSYTSGNSVYTNAGVPSVGSVIGEFHYDSNQTSEKTIQLLGNWTDASTSCLIAPNVGEREAEISVYYYPSPQKIFASSCAGLQCINEFSAKVSSTNVITDENADWLTTSTFGAGLMTVNFQTEVFGLAPNCQITPGPGYTGNIFGMINTVTASSVVVAMDQDAGSSTNFAFILTCQKQGADYNQFDQRFVPVVSDEDIVVTGAGNGDEVITASTTEIPFTEISDDDSAWDGDQFTAPTTGYYKVDGSVHYTSNTAGRVELRVGGTYTKTIGEPDSTSNIVNFNGTQLLNAGDVLSLRTNVTKTLVNSTIHHWLDIRRIRDSKKAFIGNLTPTLFTQSPGSVKPVLVSALVTDGSSTTAVTEDTSDFINGNCTNPSSGDYVCTFTTDFWNGTPHCWMQMKTTNRNDTITAVSSNSVTPDVRTSDGDAAFDGSFWLFCKGNKL